MATLCTTTTMSSSKYTRLPETGDHDGSGSYAGLDAPPEYPPAPARRTGLQTSYHLNARYPVPGPNERTTADLYASRQETLNLVREAFPVLNDYPDDSIEFFVVDHEDCWSKLLTSRFKDIATIAPKVIRVQVVDGPGDRNRRQIRTAAFVISIVAGSIIAAVLILAFLVRILSAASRG